MMTPSLFHGRRAALRDAGTDVSQFAGADIDRLESAAGEESDQLAVGRPERLGGVDRSQPVPAPPTSFSARNQSAARRRAGRPRTRGAGRPAKPRTAGCRCSTCSAANADTALAVDSPKRTTSAGRRRRGKRGPRHQRQRRPLRPQSPRRPAPSRARRAGPRRGTHRDAASRLTHFNSRAMSAADCQRSSGSFARHAVTT